MEFVKINSNQFFFFVHKEIDLGFNHIHYITTWTKYMHINRRSSYNY